MSSQLYMKMILQSLPQETDEDLIVQLIEIATQLKEHHLPLQYVKESRDAMFDLLLKMVASNSTNLTDPVKRTIVKYFD